MHQADPGDKVGGEQLNTAEGEKGEEGEMNENGEGGKETGGVDTEDEKQDTEGGEKVDEVEGEQGPLFLRQLFHKVTWVRRSLWRGNSLSL